MIAMLAALMRDSACMTVEDWTLDAEAMRFDVWVRTTSQPAPCPCCQQLSQRVHSRYTRCLADLPWAGLPVRISVEVRRLFCDNRDCERTTFAERIPTIAAPWARRTQRLAAIQQQIGLALGGSAGARLSTHLAMAAGVDLLLGLIRRAETPLRPIPRALGIDDWAWRKGQSYGTVLVDLEKGVIVDLLPDRNPETVAQWLQDHPGIEIVTRDRGKQYKDGVNQGAPDAIQIADRFHLLRNVTEAVRQVLQQHHNDIERRLKELQMSTLPDAEASCTLALPGPTCGEGASITQKETGWMRRQHQVEEAQRYHQLGWTVRAVAAELNVVSKTVRRYLRLSLPLPPDRRTRRQKLTSFKPYLLQRWNEGCHCAAHLYQEIQEQGYAGRLTILRNYVAELRKKSGLPPRKRKGVGAVLAKDPTIRLPTLRNLSWQIVRRPDALSGDEAAWVDAAKEAHTHVRLAVDLVQEFARLLRRQPSTDTFDSWLTKVDACPLSALRTFAKGLRDDNAAVRAALETNWSNGPTEGHVNRLKFVKRSMYGRAHFDLLRQRLLAA